MKTNKKPIKKVIKLKKQVKRRVKLTVVPHKANQYRPHLIRRYGLAMVLLLVIAVQAGYNVATTGRVLGVREPISTQALLHTTNERREANGLPVLVMNEQLSQAAYLKAQDMLDQQYWAHISPAGVTPWHWFNEVDYNYSYAGENLAKNFSTADAATVAWMSSPEHRANMLDSHYTDVGFAVVDGTLNGKETSLIVALYGETAAAAAVSAGVAGIQSRHVEAATQTGNLSLVTRFGVALQSITPAALGSLMLILFVSGVALVTHTYRKKLPTSMKRTWYRHHGMIKAGGMLSMCLIVVFLYGGGQI